MGPPRILVLVLAAATSVTASHASTPVEASSVYVYDGDTVVIDGKRLRLAGIDSPEIGKYRCERERRIGFAARNRLRELITQAASLVLDDTGERDKYDRPLIRLLLDGRDGGELLISEGLSVKWYPGAAAWEWRARHWCG